MPCAGRAVTHSIWRASLATSDCFTLAWRWHAHRWLGRTAVRFGPPTSQAPGVARQRLAKRQPAGESMGLGTSLLRMMRLRKRRGSNEWIVDSSAWVYGQSGSRYREFFSAIPMR